MLPQNVSLLAGQTLTITADANSLGSVWRQPDSAGGQPSERQTIAVSTTTVIGPFLLNRQYAIQSDGGALTFTQAVLQTTDSEPADVEALSSNLITVPTGRSVTNGANSQVALFGTFTVTGTLTNIGELRVGPWPI